MGNTPKNNIPDAIIEFKECINDMPIEDISSKHVLDIKEVFMQRVENLERLINKELNKDIH